MTCIHAVSILKIVVSYLFGRQQ